MNDQRRFPWFSRKAASLASIAFVTLLVASCAGGDNAQTSGSGDSEDPVTIRVVTSVTQFYPFVAVQAHEELGTWKDSGINVEVISGTTPTLGQIMAGDQADISLGYGATIASNIVSGLDETLVANNIGPWDQYVIAGTASGVNSLEELQGKTFGITGNGSPGDYTMQLMAKQLGWAPDDYKATALGDVGTLFAALAAGQVDAVVWNADQAYKLEDNGIGKIVATTSDLIGPSNLEAFGVMDEFAEKHPEAVRIFFEKYYEMVEKMQADPKLYTDVIEGWGLDPAVAQKLGENSLPLLSTDGVITEEELQGISNSIPITIGKPDSEPPIIKYVYWKDFLK